MVAWRTPVYLSYWVLYASVFVLGQFEEFPFEAELADLLLSDTDFFGASVALCRHDRRAVAVSAPGRSNGTGLVVIYRDNEDRNIVFNDVLQGGVGFGRKIDITCNLQTLTERVAISDDESNVIVYEYDRFLTKWNVLGNFTEGTQLILQEGISDLALIGDLLLIGQALGGDGGYLHVLVLQEDVWSPTALETAPFTQSVFFTDFGASVALDEATGLIVVGAPSTLNGLGGVLLYDGAPGSTFLLEAGVIFPPSGGNLRFGEGVAASNGLAAIAAPGGEGGRVFIAALFSGGLQNLHEVPYPLGGSQAAVPFTSAIALDNGVLVVGAPLESSDAAGGALVFLVNATSSSFLEALSFFGSTIPTNFGSAVAVFDDTIIIGGSEADRKESGVVFSFLGSDVPPSTAAPSASLAESPSSLQPSFVPTSSPTFSPVDVVLSVDCELRRPFFVQDGDGFGRTVEVCDDHAVVAAEELDGGEGGFSGAVFVYRDFTENLNQFLPPDQPEFSSVISGTVGYGRALALGCGHVTMQRMAVSDAEGRVIVSRYNITDRTWDQELPTLSMEGSDLFGISLAMNGTLLFVGSPSEPPSDGLVVAYGLNEELGTWEYRSNFSVSGVHDFGNTVDFASDVGIVFVGAPQANGTGAVFWFFSSGTVFMEPELGEELRGSETMEGSNFGSSLSVTEDGNTLVVGAREQVYVYQRVVSASYTWSETHVLERPGSVPSTFGISVDISNNLFVVGAPDLEEETGSAVVVYSFLAEGGGLQLNGIVESADPSTGFGVSVAIPPGANAFAIGSVGANSSSEEVFFFNFECQQPTQAPTPENQGRTFLSGPQIRPIDTDLATACDSIGQVALPRNAFENAAAVEACGVGAYIGITDTSTIGAWQRLSDFVVVYLEASDANFGFPIVFEYVNWDPLPIPPEPNGPLDVARFAQFSSNELEVGVWEDSFGDSMAPVCCQTDGSIVPVPQPSPAPSQTPVTKRPSFSPSQDSDDPIIISREPTARPSTLPTILPSLKGSEVPTVELSTQPSAEPSSAPTLGVDPRAASARISDSLVEVSVDFEVDTNRFPEKFDFFQCDVILAGPSLRNERCQWQTTRTLTILLDGAGSVYSPGDLIVVKESTGLACADECDDIQEENSVLLLAPMNPVAPEAFFLFRSQVSLCEGSTSFVDASSALFGGGRQLTFEWQYTGLFFPNETLLQAIAAANDTLEYSIDDLPPVDLTFSDSYPPELLREVGAVDDTILESTAASRNRVSGTEQRVVEDTYDHYSSYYGYDVDSAKLRLSVTITNFVGMSSFFSGIEVLRIAETNFAGRIDGFQERVLRVDQQSTFQGSVVSPCELVQHTGGPLLFDWLIIDSTGQPVSVDNDTSQGNVLVLPQYSGLRAGEAYELLFQVFTPGPVSTSIPQLESESSIELYVSTLPLTERVSGCDVSLSPFVFSPEAQKPVIDPGVVHVVNASLSFDPNVGPFSSQPAREAVQVFLRSATATSLDDAPCVEETVSPTWEPTESFDLEPSAGPTGPPQDLNKPVQDSSEAPSNEPTREVSKEPSTQPSRRSCEDAVQDSVTFSEGGETLLLDVPALVGCKIDLNMTLTTTESPAVDRSTTCTIRVVESISPVVEIITSFTNKVSPSDALRIAAEVGLSQQPIFSSWSLIEGSISDGRSLADVARSALNATYVPSIAMARAPFNLVIAENSLIERLSYTFELFADFVDNDPFTIPARVEVSFVVNERPSSGSFNVVPTNGSFDERFALQAIGWEDPDLPLRFEFRGRPRGRDEISFLNPSNPQNVISDVLLPVGIAIEGFDVDLLATIIDSLDAATQVQTTVQVFAAGNVVEGQDSAEEALDALEQEGVSDIDSVYNTLGFAAALIRPGDTFDSSEETRSRQLQRQGLRILSSAIIEHFSSPELFDSQATSLESLSATDNADSGDGSSSSGNALLTEIAEEVIALAELILGNAGGLLSTTAAGADTEESSLRGPSAEALVRALSNILELGDAPTSTSGVPEGIGRASQALQRVRSVSLLAGEDPEVLTSRRIINTFSRRSFEPDQEYVVATDPPSSSSQELRARLDLSVQFIASIGVGLLEEFLFGFVALDDNAYSQLGESSSGSDLRSLVTGVHRLAVTLEPTSSTAAPQVTATFTEVLDGQLELVQALSVDTSSDLVCEEESSEDCENFLACSVYNPESRSFQVLEECTAEFRPPDLTSPFGSVACLCDFGGLRRLQGGSSDPDGQEDDSQVSLDFGTLLVASGQNFNNFENFGEPQPLVYVTAAFFTILFCVFAYMAHEKDEEDAKTAREEALAKMKVAREWMEENGLEEELIAKLVPAEDELMASGSMPLTPPCCDSETGSRSPSNSTWPTQGSGGQSKTLITSMDDLRLLKRQTWSELADFCREHSISEAEGKALKTALSNLGKTAEGSKDEKIDPIKLEAALRTNPRLDIYFWYGLLLATPHRLLDYKDTPLKKYLWSALKSRHDAIDAMSLHEGNAPTRFVRVLYFATSIYAALFVTAVVYQVIYPDDEDFCNDQNFGEDVCEEDESQLNSNENRCFFDEDSFECRPTEPDPNTTGVVVAAAFTLLFMAPLAVYFRWHVNTFLSDPPPELNNLLDERKHRRKKILAKSEVKRAVRLCEEELSLLRRRPLLQPVFFQRMWPDWLADRVLEVRVRVAAYHAAKIETDLDAERSTWGLHNADAFSPEEYNALLEEVMERKILVTKIAVRDSLPWIKSLVFRSYTSFTMIADTPSQQVRYLAIGFMLLFDLFCIVYLLAFGANITFDQSVGWLVSFLLGEIIVVFLLITLRITILNVVMPSLVRPDVTVERACMNIPHYSAAGIFARKRPDLVPGLSAVFDARFQGLDKDTVSPPSREEHERGSIVSKFTALFSPTSETKATAGPSNGEREHQSRKSSGTLTTLMNRLAKDESTVRSNEGGYEGRDSLSIAELKSSSAVAPMRRNSAQYSTRERKDKLRKMDFLTVTGIGSAYQASVDYVSGLSFGGSDEYGSSTFRASGQVSTSPGGESKLSSDRFAMNMDSRVHSGMSVDDEDAEEQKIVKGVKQTREKVPLPTPSGTLSSEEEEAEEKLAPEDPGDDTHLLDAGKTLRRRHMLLKWGTRILLVAFALVLIWPEPVQEFLLEEGIPVGLTLVLLVGFNLDVEEGVEVLIAFFIIMTVACFGVALVYLVSREIMRNLGTFRLLWNPQGKRASEKYVEMSPRATRGKE